MENVNLKVGLNASVELGFPRKYGGRIRKRNMDVYATPAMIGLMERAALSAVALHLPKGYTTVGTGGKHQAYCRYTCGNESKSLAELIAVEGRKLTFKVEAFDGVEKIGEGYHERYIVSSQNFRDKVYKKAENI